MSACEKCWRDANQRALHFGGSVVDHYHDLPDRADCGVHNEWHEWVPYVDPLSD